MGARRAHDVVAAMHEQQDPVAPDPRHLHPFCGVVAQPLQREAGIARQHFEPRRRLPLAPSLRQRRRRALRCSEPIPLGPCLGTEHG